MYWEKEIRIRLTTRRIFGGILAAMSVVNLVIVGTVFSSSSSAPLSTATATLTTSPPIVISPYAPPSKQEAFTPPLIFTATLTLTSSASPTSTPIPTDTFMPPPSVTLCVPWSAWPVYRVQPGDTLTAIARLTGSTVPELRLANCLPGSRIYTGQGLYVPRLPPTETLPPEPEITSCPMPKGWQVYIVQANDTLFSIARAIEYSAERLVTANCLHDINLYQGQQLYVPRLPVTAEPPPTDVPTPSEVPVYFYDPVLTPVATSAPSKGG